MANILTAAEAAQVLRCTNTDALMLALLPSVDAYIRQATGHDWANDSTIHALAKAAARILITLWHENPGMIGSQGALPWGLSAALAQLEALALRYKTFEGLSSAGWVSLPWAKAGDVVAELVGVVNTSGNQAASFAAYVEFDGLLEQTSSSDLSEKWFRVLLTPPE
jgi:hypothetical protein